MKISRKKIIGITMGDPAGIGPEVIAKALSKPAVRKLAEFLIIGNYKTYSKFAKDTYSNCSLLDIQTKNDNKIRVGRESIYSGEASLRYLETAVEILKNNKIDALVTAPVSKESICRVSPKFTGHTEFLAKAFKVKREGMLFVSGKTRVIIATRHIPLNKVSSQITEQKILDTICLLDKSLKDIFKIRRPSIGICGLNPHAGEGGNIGKEEINDIIPAIKKANKKGIAAKGPFPADTIFTKNMIDKFDAIIAMYHDQGLVGIKTLHFDKLVNMTIGLPFIRTSPAHGTAFNIAGKDIADETSMCEAIKLSAIN